MTSKPVSALRMSLLKVGGEELLSSFFMAGFDASSHRRKDGKRLDLLAGTRHDVLAAQDYRRCAEIGLTTLRDGLRWHLIEQAPGRYDFSSWRPMLQAARKAGVRVIWDLFHYGHPDFLSIGAAGFAEAFYNFSAEAARVHREASDETPLFCPFNEISFFAWAVDAKYFPPAGRLRGRELKRELVRIALAGVAGARSVDPRARFVFAEPLIHVAPRHHGRSERSRAEGYRVAQFEAYEMLLGRTDADLGGAEDAVDVLGLNYYPHNQWYYHGPTIPMGHHEYRALADILVEAQARFGKPMILAETGAEGSARPAWLHYVCDEVRAAQGRGARIDGVCLFPVTAYLGWDNDRHCDVGLFSHADGAGHREAFAPMLDELERQKALFAPGEASRRRA